MKKRSIITVVMVLTFLIPCLRAGVVINEVFYDPTGDDKTAVNREFVELYNNGSDPVYLGGHRLQAAGPYWKTTYRIAPRTIIPAHSYLLIAEGETFGVTPDLVAGLTLPNGNYEAYYDGQWHSFTKPVVGVRLVSPDGAEVLDCLLYNDGELGNQNNLETDGAALDGFYPDVPSGYSISRVAAGYDSDYLSDWETLTAPTPAARGVLLDSDNDGLLDVIESYIGTNPQNPDTDGDGLLDGEEMSSGHLEIGPNETDPRDSDTEGDVLGDGLEVNTYFSDPLDPDTDGDGLLDGEEVYIHGTSPTNPDSDFDGYPDGREVTYGTDPLVPASRPGVVINEVYYDHPGSDDRMEYITLYNPEFYDVDISYFRVESAGTSFKRELVFPAGTVIPAGCFFLVGEDDAVDMNGNPPDLISWLDLQNGDQNDPDAYYYGAQSPTDGVRLTGPKGEGPAIAIDTVLWDSPNDHNLPGDAADPATVDELIPDVPPGQALRRRIAGYDTNHKSDWEEVMPVKVSSASGQDPDCDGLTNYEEEAEGTNTLNPDTDGDGVSDGDEVWHGYDPLDPDSVPLSVKDAVIRNFPIRSGDFNGDGTPDISFFRPATGLWAVKNLTRVYFGQGGDIPQPGDYNGNGTTDITIFRPSSGLWAARDLTRVYFGNQTDLPVSGDYDGDGTSDFGFFRPGDGQWKIRDMTRVYFGTSGDIPVPAEYGGPTPNSDNIAIFRPSNGLWAVRGYTRIYYGRALDMPVPEAAPNADLAFQAIFRERTGLWAVRGYDRIYYGTLGDLPVAAKWAQYDPVTYKTIGIFRPSTGLWSIRNHTRTFFGGTNDMPLPMLYRGTDSDCDGLPDWWEDQYFGDLSQGPQDNPDGDWCNNLEEYRSGTDPTEIDCGSSPTPSPIPSPTPTPTPDYVEPVFPPSSSSGDSVPYIIITNEALKNAEVYPNFQTLLFHRLARGMRGAIITVEQIDEEYDGRRPAGGSDLQTKIRQFIYDAYINWGTDYVLLGGDVYIVPPRFFPIFPDECWDGPQCPPADLYFSCLDRKLDGNGVDWTFDSDGDGIYGEWQEDNNTDGCDFLSEVSVGRFSVDSDYELANVINKTLLYENSEGTYLHKVALLDIELVGQIPGSHQEKIHWGNDGSYYGMGPTIGFNRSHFFNRVAKYYDEQYGSNTWTAQSVINAMNVDDCHIFNTTSHGTWNNGMRISKPDLDCVTNSNPFFLNAACCNSGDYQLLTSHSAFSYSLDDPPLYSVVNDFKNNGYPYDIAIIMDNIVDNIIFLYGDEDIYGNYNVYGSSMNTVPSIPTSVTTADFNSDSYNDLAVSCENGRIYILWNDGSGGFTLGDANYNVGTLPISMVTGPLNSDQYPDLAVCLNISGSNGKLILLWASQQGSFSIGPDITIGEGSKSIISSYFDNDEYPDLAVACEESGDGYILLNDDNDPGNFNVHTIIQSFDKAKPFQVVADHYYYEPEKETQDLDLAFACRGLENGEYYYKVNILKGDGSGHFQSHQEMEFSVQAENGLNAIASSDLNEDGIPELITSIKVPDYHFERISIYVGEGDYYYRVYLPQVNVGGTEIRSGISAFLDSDNRKDFLFCSKKSTKPEIIWSNTKNNECFWEYMINQSGDHWAFAIIGNTTWGSQYGNGILQLLFWDGVFGNNIDKIGDAHFYSKDSYAGDFRNPPFYGLTLFGDPATKLNYIQVPFTFDSCDFNGDGTSDYGVFHYYNNAGYWLIKDLWNNVVVNNVAFGSWTDIPVSGDYNGDGITDLAVYKRSPDENGNNWLIDINRDGNSDIAVSFGMDGDYPIPADYNGDGTTDISCFSPILGYWNIRNITTLNYGMGHHLDIPISADYNGSGSKDTAFFIPSTGNWVIDINLSGAFDIQTEFGEYRDLPIPSDYDGDNTSEIAVYAYNTGEWKVQNMPSWSFDTNIFTWDIPSPADYDGDGSSDIAVYRLGYATQSDGAWIFQTGAEGYFIKYLGDYYDIPVSKQP